jgi:phage terminase large subunit-like protein
MQMKIYCKEIDDYIKYSKTHKEEIPEEIFLLFENVIIPTLEKGEVYYDEKQTKQCIAYCEKWYYKLGIYQKAIYACVFMYEKDNHDIVKFPDIFLLIARGNGKDGLIMPLANYLQTHFYGVKNYHIDIVATAEETALNSYNVVYNMLESNKAVMKKYFYWNKVEIINRQTKSILRYNTSNAATKYGKQTGMIIFNELHTYVDYKQLNTFTSGLGKIKHARIITITTDGVVRDGPLDEKKDLAMQVLRGEPNYLGLLPFIYRVNSEADIHNPMKKFLETKNKNDIDYSNWCKANPSLKFMPTLKEQLFKDYMKMTIQRSYKQEYYPQRMNFPMIKEDDAVTSWENLEKASYKNIENKIERDKPNLTSMLTVVGMDMASLNDFASAGFLFKDKNEYIWIQKTWICSNGRFFSDIKFPFHLAGEYGYTDFEVVNTSTISEDEIILWVINEMQKYNLKRIKMDNYQFKLYRKTFEKYGITEYHEKTNPGGQLEMIRYPASIAAIYAPKIEVEFEEGRINIGNSAIMRWAINNTKVVTKKDGNKVYEKIEPKLRKNDPFMAFVCAMSGEELLNEQVIYVYV